MKKHLTVIKHSSKCFQVLNHSSLLPRLGEEFHSPDEAIGPKFPLEASKKILSCLTDLMGSRAGDNLSKCCVPGLT